MIQDASFPDNAALGLFLYWNGTTRGGEVRRTFEETYKLTGEASRRLKAAVRAEGLERSPRNRGSRGPSRRPATAARTEALEVPFPGVPSDIGTIGDAMDRVRRETGRELTLAESRRALVKSGGRRSRLDSRLCLVALQELAKDYGVTLGYASIAALADCAGPEKYRDKFGARELQRYLKDFSGEARQMVETWKPLTMRRDEFPHLFSPLRKK
jgi:hypothetical protein